MTSERQAARRPSHVGRAKSRRHRRTSSEGEARHAFERLISSNRVRRDAAGPESSDGTEGAAAAARAERAAPPARKVPQELEQRSTVEC